MRHPRNGSVREQETVKRFRGIGEILKRGHHLLNVAALDSWKSQFGDEQIFNETECTSAEKRESIFTIVSGQDPILNSITILAAERVLKLRERP